MGWLIDELISELVFGLARRLYRTLGWIGCLIISLGLLAMVALVIWLIVVSVR
ncbi:MAG: hypothetical protein JWO16_1941 [Sphingomonas bacterium]|jgi:hypothetical protein|nr:hypothetical protein [Sphingomonas bacterium]